MIDYLPTHLPSFTLEVT